jgi:protein arginine N-methyltransferase 1
MLSDTRRMDAYAAALDRTVRPGSVVVDIGTGTGIMALLAARCGARRVYAIEPSEVAEVARKTVDENGLSGVVTLVTGRSTDVELPERADVIVSDLRGLLPLYDGHLTAVIDARRRLLAPGGVLVPSRDAVLAALVEAPGEYARVDGWNRENRGFRLDCGREHVVNTFWKGRSIESTSLLGRPETLLELHYETIADPNAFGRAELGVDRHGTAHGLCVWFDTVLVDGIGFSNAPGQPDLVYGRAFFPLSEPVDVEPGTRVGVELTASLVDGDYVFRWRTEVRAPDGRTAAYAQSTIQSFPLSPQLLHASLETTTPALSQQGELARDALARMDGSRSVGDIADALADRAGSREDALRIVTRLAHKYGAP